MDCWVLRTLRLNSKMRVSSLVESRATRAGPYCETLLINPEHLPRSQRQELDDFVMSA